MSNDKDMSWAIFTHRLDGNYNHWGPAVITNTPANHYGDLSGKALQVNDGGGPGILMFSYRSGRMIMHINGEQKLNHTGLTGAIQAKLDLDISIGGYHNGSNKQKMRLGEVMIFNDVLTAENVKKVEGQLAHKWALTHVLPSSHTYEKTLNLDGSISFVENLPATTVIGSVSDLVSDYNSSLDYSLSEANSSNDNHLFAVDSSGNISVSYILDFETNATQYTITILAKDGSAVKSSNNFILHLSNVDDDFDDDGFSNEEEEAYGSDPEDKESIPNSAPTNISGSLGVSENAEPGQVAGTVSVTDPDEGQSFSYSLVSRTAGANAIL
jgi:hypothetical protein